MDIMMVEPAQMDASSKMPAERQASGLIGQGFGHVMDSALGLVEVGVNEKIGVVAEAAVLLSDFVSDAGASDHEVREVSQSLELKEAPQPAYDDEPLPGGGFLVEDEGEDLPGLNPYAFDPFLKPAFQHVPVQPLTPAGGIEQGPVIGIGNVIEATVVPQYFSGIGQGGTQSEMPALESSVVSGDAILLEGSCLKAGEAPDERGPVQSDADNLDGASEPGVDTGLQAGLKAVRGSQDAAKASFQEVAPLTPRHFGLEPIIESPYASKTLTREVDLLPVDRTSAGPFSGISVKAEAEDISLTSQSGDPEVSREGITIGGLDQATSGMGERDGLGRGGGSDGNSDTAFGSGPQVAAQMEARTGAGFSLDQVGTERPSLASESPISETEVLDRFADGVRLSISNGMKEVRINMHPEELGGVTIRLRVDNGTVSAHVLVDNQSVKGIFDSDTGSLRDVFAQNGLALGSISVELSSGQGFTNGSSGGQHNGWGEEPVLPHRYAYQEPAGMENGRAAQALSGIGRPAGGIDLFA